MSHFVAHGHFMRVCGRFKGISLMDLNYELSLGSLSSKYLPAGKRISCRSLKNLSGRARIMPG